jgi:hypothetical protein
MNSSAMRQCDQTLRRDLTGPLAPGEASQWVARLSNTSKRPGGIAPRPLSPYMYLVPMSLSVSSYLSFSLAFFVSPVVSRGGSGQQHAAASIYLEIAMPSREIPR